MFYITVNNEAKLTERLKGWILGLINGIDARMLVTMIKNNDIPTLWEYELPKGFDFVKSLVVQYKDIIMENLTLETVMTYAKEYRPDLARILVHKKAQEWMNRFLKKIQFMFQYIELEPYEIQAKYEERMMELQQKRDAIQAEKIEFLLAQEQKALDLQAEIETKELEKKRLDKERKREQIIREKEQKAEAKRLARIKYEEERASIRGLKPVIHEPQIELIPEVEVEKQLKEQETKSQVDLDDEIDKKLFTVLGKNTSDNKFDFL